MGKGPQFLLLGCLAASCGCASSEKPVGKPVSAVWEEPATPVQSKPVGAAYETDASLPPATGPADSASDDPQRSTFIDAIATVNGSPIPRHEFIDLLIASHGLDLLNQFILLTTSQQKAAELGLKVHPADIEDEHDEALRRIVQPIGASDEILFDRSVAEKLLSDFLTAKNISRSQWEMRMEQRAYTRKIAEHEVAQTPITDQMLRDQYTLDYGEKVQIRHIQLSRPELVQEARALLDGGTDFELVARKLSENPISRAQGGLMPPFTRNDNAVPPLIRETAFGLKPHETSMPVSTDSWYHLIRLERRFPASEVGYDNVDHEALESRLKERLIRQHQEALDDELFDKAKVSISDPELARQFRRSRLPTAN